MSGLLGKMKAMASNLPVPMEDDDCEICRMLREHGTVVDVTELPDGSVIEVVQMPDDAPPIPGLKPWPPGPPAPQRRRKRGGT